MSNVTRHYQDLLAEHYLWMFGLSFEEKVAEQKAILEKVLARTARGSAVDLGSGPGFQSIALAELGYSPVLAVDTSTHLLAELKARTASHRIEAKEADLLSLASLCPQNSAAAIVCMGDTLTHLASKTDVESVITTVFQKLVRSGMFVITYRDLTGELLGLDRFVSVRTDDAKLLTCFLEYKDDQKVVINDLLYLKEESGWQLKKSNYEKLRLSQEWVVNSLRGVGFEVELQEPAGRLLLIAARKP